MDTAYLLLAASLIISAALVAFALLRRKQEPVPAADQRLDHVIVAQGEIAGQFKQTIAAQAELQRTMSHQIEALNRRVSETLSESATKTAATISSIGERLTVIDEAQKNIAGLSTQVMSLQEILSDKQTRGAFGQDRMEAIVADQLAPGHYEFQPTLSNGSRPDCIIRVPNVKGVIVVDSKFPLEAYEALRQAAESERKPALARLKADIQKHVKDIAEKYLIPGEVQTPAIMFVPSESIYAELHISCSELVQKARRMQVVIVSPHVFMLAINTIQTLMRDARMREQAHRIQAAVVELLQDVKRLGDRVGNLRSHFDRANKDIAEIETSMKRIEGRASRIEQVELALPDETATAEPPRLKVVQSGLRAVNAADSVPSSR
ncbi:MAG: DNA recombination protein RmuC [Alphaproteobacteria bacterium]|nr:DNA recombination protein RmuC [Alphaproteobacteria bacterium]